MTLQETDLKSQLAERFKLQPKVIQDAITSADVEKRLRSLADTNKLHLDQWQVFENEIMLTLLGFQRVEDLEKNIVQHVGVTSEVARSLSEGANTVIFQPVRAELERGLEYPDAQVASISGTEAARTQAIDEAHAEAAAAAPTVAPATPPAPAPDVKIARPTEASAYKPGEPSHARTAVHDDPYRESPV